MRTKTLSLPNRLSWLGLVLGFAPWMAFSAEPSPDEIAFFESRIRPILSQDCYECHSSTGKRKAGLALDHRQGLLQGGDSGPVIIPGDPDSSLLMEAILHQNEDLQMPKAGAKLEASVLADFQKWITLGAPDPRDHPPSEETLAQDTNWEAVMERRKRWWSFQPLNRHALDQVPGNEHMHPVDRFVRAKLAEADLEPADPADPAALLRRLSFVLRGLPPTPREVDAFSQDPTDDVYNDIVDSFLESPRFGERWARHWMDWMRYADSHGSEGDPMIPYAWRYRDYLIRALNRDVPYDQMAREHLAGDLLEKPRLNTELGLNESALGPGHLRMVFHGFAPTDALDEQVRFTDDQINVVSQAFLGLTVSCARCHDHKFDPISQRDFYGWYGVFASCPPASIAVDAPSAETKSTRESLGQIKSELKSALIETWLEQLPALREAWTQKDGLAAEIDNATALRHLLHPLRVARDQGDVTAALAKWKAQPSTLTKVTPIVDWDFRQETAVHTWRRDGGSVGHVAPNGSFVVAPAGERVLDGVYPSGIYSHLVSDKDRGVLLSPRVLLDAEYELWMHVAGDGGAFMRYAVQNYPRSGTVYPVGRLNGGRWQWQRYDLDYWTGDHIHVEITTAADQPVLAETEAARSWFGVRRVMLTKRGQAPVQNAYAFASPLLAALEEESSLPAAYAKALQTCLLAWRNDTLTEAQALYLDEAFRTGLLPNRLDQLPSVRPLVESYRKHEAQVPVPTRAPGVLEKDAYDQPFFERGDHKQPRDPVPRHFLDAIDSSAYQTSRSGRLELANDLFRPDNPLTKRVIVNRIWHHVFGEGLVRTPDNFGRLGGKPSHPELLDHLAFWFQEQGYSVKALIRYLVTSQTWRASSTPSEAAQARDPENRLLSHAHLRRLEAEAIRDALLDVSGRLDRESMYGPPVLGDSNRRSVYLRVKRNDLEPLLGTFDAPVPASTKGRRDVTNVPGQSLTLLNDPFVIRLATAWADSLQTEPEKERLEKMFLQALGRRPSAEERARAEAFLEHSERDEQALEKEIQTVREALETTKDQLATLIAGVKQRVLEQRPGSSSSSSENLPKPFAFWDFDDDFQDRAGISHAEAHGTARLENGHLVLDGQPGTYVSTGPLERPLREKTLEAWVQLDNLQQQGGGVLSVQDLGGVTFDAIVFGERDPAQWLAGSNNFTRTQSFGGPSEVDAAGEFIHVAVVYDADGTITGYRQGKPYGTPYQSRGPVTFEQGNVQVLFGNRHGKPGGNRLLQGRIDKAALYARALTAEEIAAFASGDPSFVSRSEWLAAASADEGADEARLAAKLDTMSKRLEALEADREGPVGWAGLAHALFNLKEFLYLR